MTVPREDAEGTLAPVGYQSGLAGWRVVWEHVKSGDVFTGDLWENREDADYVADMLRATGYATNVRVRKAAR